MERIITTTLNMKSSIKFCTAFFSFHGTSFCDPSWVARSQYIIAPAKYVPRIVQEAIIIIELKKILKKEKISTIICLDEKACKLAYLARQKNIKLVSWLHRSIDTFKNKKNIDLVDEHVAISKEIGDQLKCISDKPIQILHNCVSLEKYYSFVRREEGLSAFVYVGRIEFESQKRLKDLLIAFANLNEANCKLHIVGDGAKTEVVKCDALCKKLSISNNVVFHGWHDDPWKYCFLNINNIVALCLTSSYEGFPMVLIEAISQGIPCISSNCPTGPAEIISDCNGFLYPPQDLKSLTSCMKKALTQKFVQDKMIDSLRDLCSEKMYALRWENIID